MILRTYALYDRNLGVLLAISSLGMVVPALGLVSGFHSVAQALNTLV